MSETLKKLNELVGSRMEDRDDHHLDPTERAEVVQEFLFVALGLDGPEDAVENPLFWDLISYASQVFAAYAIQSEDGEALDLAKKLSHYVHSRHYSVGDNHPILGPGKEKHLKVWVKRIKDLQEVFLDEED